MANILITGASSGIGEALAFYYAKKGGNTLFLSGRNKERLDDVVEKCVGFGAATFGYVLDVKEKDAMDRWIKECHKKAPLNLVIANAGVSSGDDEDFSSIYNTFDINVGGVVNTVMPALDIFKKEDYKQRQIAIVSSLAGFYPMSQCPAYSASKNCVKAFGLALRGRYKKQGILFNVICPGFVRSRITDKNTCPMPFFMEAEKSAKIIVKGLIKNKAMIAFPWQMASVVYIVSSLPYFLTSFVMGLLPKKNSR